MIRSTLTCWRVVLSILFSIGFLWRTSSALVAESPGCAMRVGLFMPLSGPAATVGDDFRRAALLSHEKLSPEARSRLTMAFEDTQLNAAVAVNAYRAMRAREHIDALVVSFAESTNALAPLADRAKIPLIGCSPTRQFLRDRPYTFRHWTDPETMSPLLVDEITRQGKKEVGLVFSEHPAMMEFARYFQDYATSRGLRFSQVSSVLPNDTDFKAIATQLASRKLDGVVYFLLPPQPSQFTKQFRAVDKSTQLFAFINTESEGEVAAAGGAMEGVIYVGPTFAESFIREFKDRHQGGFPEICSGNFYDIVQMLGQAVLAGKCSGDSLRQFLGELRSFHGVAGYYGVSAEREFKVNVELRTVRGGTFEKYKPYRR